MQVCVINSSHNLRWINIILCIHVADILNMVIFLTKLQAFKLRHFFVDSRKRVASLCYQLLLQFLMDQFETLQHVTDILEGHNLSFDKNRLLTSAFSVLVTDIG